MTMLDRLRELEAKATKGPWVYVSEEELIADVERGYLVADVCGGAFDSIGTHGQDARNAALIVAARNALPLLLRVAECAERAADNWRTCGSLSEANRGNALDDLLSAVLAMRSEQ